MRFGVVTLFPELLDAFLAAGVVGRAVKNSSIEVQLENPRNHTVDGHRTVDDRPFGGGPGMVMKAEPLGRAIQAVKQSMPLAKTIYLSPQGRPLTQAMLRDWSKLPGIILVAGRYEGIDERVIQRHIDEEVSIGDYVLSGGEVAAMVIVDGVSRLLPGVLGHPDSAAEDSFGEDGLLDHPHYTRPEWLDDLEGASDATEHEDTRSVPAVLLSGDHKLIAQWRRDAAIKRTWERRPELLANATISVAERKQIEQLNRAGRDGATEPQQVEKNEQDH